MAIDYFLKLDGIQGESLSTKHQNEIEVLSWSWGLQNGADVAHGSGASTGKVRMSELTIQKPVDKSSAKLLGLSWSGKVIKTGVLTCSKSTGDKNPADFLTISLEQIYVTSFQDGGGSGDPTGTESLSFSFNKMTYDYKVQNPDGSLVSGGTASYETSTRTSG
jgi:type VI secretion system secreted protein Hcp